jgi:hypothetical protein
VRHTALRSLGRASLFIASLLIAGTAAHADPISVNYSTSMFISNIGVEGAPVVGYVGVTNATASTEATATYGTVLNPLPSGMGSVLPLGRITITPPSGEDAKATTTYDHTPFYLTVTVNSVNGDPHAANPSTFTVAGYLTGALTSNGPSSLTATFLTPDFQSPSLPAGTIATLSSGGFDTFLSMPGGSTSIGRPDGLPAGLSLGGSVVSVHSAPEPASFAVLALLGLAQAGVVRLRNRRRRGLAA